ncbi:MAG TPA: MFS transporter [Pseudonocardiaceae bacterium]|jgi:EmrB/QacA subfamily drug resistance transporter|nr:MFS transporter [Pseudonocardiaceae bacterium]
MTESYQPDPRRWRGLAICLVAGFMTLLDVSIVNVALPSMQNGLGASASDLSWVVSGYALTFGLVLVPAGRLGDEHGRKRMFLIGVALFTATSALCGVAPTATLLVAARLLQGMACGLLNPQVVGMIQFLFRGKERGRAFGFYGAVIGISTAIGPLAGGLLLQVAGVQDGWRWVFYVNLPIGIAAVAAGWRLLPRDRPSGNHQTLDAVGAILLGLGIVSVMFPLIEAEQGVSTAHWWLLAVGAALLVAFVVWERGFGRRGHHPLVNLELLRNYGYAIGAGLGLLYFAGFTGIFFVMTLFYQRGLGYSPLDAGAAMLSFAIGSAVSAGVGGRYVFRLGRLMIVLGLGAVAVGLAGTALLVADYTGSHIGLVVSIPLLLAGVGSGIVISPNQTLALNDVPPAEGGTAAAVLQTGQRIGSAIGTAVAGSLLFGNLISTRGDFHASAAAAMWGATILVGVALLAGVGDLVRSRLTGRTDRKLDGVPGAT